jgi:hypothetical protein
LIDARGLMREHLRMHPRVAYQSLSSPEQRNRLATELPQLVPFGASEYHGLIAVLDWDHRLPSRSLVLRLFAFASEESLRRGEQAWETRLEEIGQKDKFPEFDVPDFDGLAADEAYEAEVTLEGELGRLRLVSSWRRDLADADAEAAVGVARRSEEFRRIRAETSGRPPHLGDLEAVGWCPPCESDLTVWTLDVWYLTAFDGQIGRGRSLLVHLDARKVVATRDFTVRVG